MGLAAAGKRAASMPVDAITALLGLDQTLGLAEGESLWIFGASGGLGHLSAALLKITVHDSDAESPTNCTFQPEEGGRSTRRHA